MAFCFSIHSWQRQAEALACDRDVLWKFGHRVAIECSAAKPPRGGDAVEPCSTKFCHWQDEESGAATFQQSPVEEPSAVLATEAVQEEPAEPDAAPPGAGGGAEADPFGLDSLLEQPKPAEAAPKPAAPPPRPEPEVPPGLWVGQVIQSAPKCNNATWRAITGPESVACDAAPGRKVDGGLGGRRPVGIPLEHVRHHAALLNLAPAAGASGKEAGGAPGMFRVSAGGLFEALGPDLHRHRDAGAAADPCRLSRTSLRAQEVGTALSIDLKENDLLQRPSSPEM